MTSSVAAPVSPLRRFTRGIGSSTLTHAIGALQNVVLVPFFLHAWGADGYGRWITLAAVAAYVNLFDLGGQTYMANVLAIHHARREDHEFSDRLSEGVSFFVALGVLSFAVILGGLAILTDVPWRGSGALLDRETATILSILTAVPLLLAIPGGVYATAYRAAGLFARGAVVGNIVRAGGLGVSVALLAGGAGPVGYAVGLMAVSSVSMILVVFDTRRIVPQCRRVRLSLADASRGRRHLRGAVAFWMISLAQTANQQGVVVVLALLHSPAAVAVYATHRTLVSVSGYAGSLVQAPLAPELSFLWARHRQAALREVSFTAVRAVILMTGALAIMLWVGGPLVYPAWTGGRLPLDPVLFAVLLAQAVLAAGWMTSAWSLLAANHHATVARWALLNAGVTLALAALWAGQVGAVGIALGSLVADVVCGLAVFPVLAARFLTIGARDVYGHVVRATLSLVPLFVVAAALPLLIAGWWAVIVTIALMATFAYPLACHVIGRRDTRRGLAAIIGRQSVEAG